MQSVNRVLDLLELMARSGEELGLSQLAARSGLPIATIHRLVRRAAAGLADELENPTAEPLP